MFRGDENCRQTRSGGETEKPMISKLVRLVILNLSSVVLLGTFLWAQPVLPATCSVSTLHQRYGFAINGTSSGNPITAVGQIATDGNGTLAGNETISENGSVRNLLEVLGKYTINSNCTGTMTIQARGRSKQNFDITVSFDGSQVEMIQNNSGTTILGTAQAQVSKSCSLAGVKGTYSLQGGGTEIGVGPLALAGQITLRGGGTLDGTATVSVNGLIASKQKISGAYKVLRICQAAAVIQVGNQGPIHLSLVVVNGEDKVLFIEGDANTLLSGSLQR
jgi:hypothetical protein